MTDIQTQRERIRKMVSGIQWGAYAPAAPGATDGRLDAPTRQLLDDAYNEYLIHERVTELPEALPSKKLLAWEAACKAFENAGPRADTATKERLAETLEACFSTLSEDVQKILLHKQDIAAQALPELIQMTASEGELALLKSHLICMDAQSLGFPKRFRDVPADYYEDRILEYAHSHGFLKAMDDSWAQYFPKLAPLLTTNAIEAMTGTEKLSADAQGRYVVYYSFDDPLAMPKVLDRPTENLRDMTEAQRDVVRQVLREYEAVIPIQFMERSALDFDDGPKMRFLLGDIVRTKENGQHRVMAYADFPGPAIQYMVFDPLRPSNKAPHTDTEFRHIVTHEIGHAIGLHHPFEAHLHYGYPMLKKAMDQMRATHMSYSHQRYIPELEQYPQTPGPLDILAAQALYGKNPEHNQGNTRYVWHDARTHRVVYDAAGFDTFDTSALPYVDAKVVRTTLDGTITENVANGQELIRTAPGVSIERFIGSDNHDIVSSGRQRHALRGNGGLDSFLIPAHGTHVIEDFSLQQADQLVLPEMQQWKTRITQNGWLQLVGTSPKDGLQVEIYVQTVDGTAAEALQRITHQNKSATNGLPQKIALPASIQNNEAERELRAAAETMAEWVKNMPAAEEVSDLCSVGTPTIRALPVVAREKNLGPKK